VVVKEGSMTQSSQYAIIDTAQGSQSRGKTLLLLDDERVAQEIASELRRRGLAVAIEGRASGPGASQVADRADQRQGVTSSPLRIPVAGA
jgi:hypothetical protein